MVRCRWRWSFVLLFLPFAARCTRGGGAGGTLAPERGGIVESRWHDGHVFVRVWIDDRPVWLLLDSGASNTLVRSSVLAAIGAKPLDTAFMDGAANRLAVRAFSGALLRADSVLIAVPTLYELPAAVPALDGAPDVDGILGFELFAQSRVVLDPARRTVRIVASADSSEPSVEALAFQLQQRVPIVLAELSFADGSRVRAPFILDLGSNSDVHVTRAFAAAHQIEARLTGRESSLEAGLWTNERGTEGHALAIKIGRDVVRAPAVFIAGESEGALAWPNVAGFIGLGVLRQFRVHFDYASHRIALDRVAGFVRDTARRCTSAHPVPRRPVVLRGGPTAPSATSLAAASPDRQPPDSVCTRP